MIAKCNHLIAAAQGCSGDWTGERDGYCYSVLSVSDKLTWHEARERCFGLSPGGDLTSIETEEERIHISNVVSGPKHLILSIKFIK